MTGHYRMHRGWMDNPALGGDREPFCRRAAWAWLIENANWKAVKVDAGGTTVVVERGQLCASFRYLSKAWGWSLGKVQLFIDRLKTDTMINTAVNTGRMVITICNYEKYQASVETANTPSNTVANTPPIREQYESKKESKKEEYTNGPASDSVHTHTEPAAAPIGAAGFSVAYLGKAFTLNAKDYEGLKKRCHALQDFHGALQTMDQVLTAEMGGKPAGKIYAALNAKMFAKHELELRIKAERAEKQRPKQPNRAGIRNLGPSRQAGAA